MVVLKVYHASEVKRFQFENAESVSFERFKEVCKTNFRSLTSEHCFKYVDDEGDLCTFNEATATDALSIFQSKSKKPIPPTVSQAESSTPAKEESSTESELPAVLHLFVCEPHWTPTLSSGRHARVLPSLIRQRSKTQGYKNICPVSTVHHGITCDSCGKCPIVGDRYKCEGCEDFDVCAKCYCDPPSDELVDHLVNHEFTQMSPTDTLRRRQGATRRVAECARPLFTAEASSGIPMETETPTSPRLSSEWTEVSVGPPQIEGLLSAIGVDVGSAKEAVKQFITTGEFGQIIEHLSTLRSSSTTPSPPEQQQASPQ